MLLRPVGGRAPEHLRDELTVKDVEVISEFPGLTLAHELASDSATASQW
jgi:hypothetical protein